MIRGKGGGETSTRPLDRMRDDDGSILPLTIFYAAFSLILILIVVAATSLYLERKRLYTLADGAALAGAEAFDLDDVRVVDGAPRAELTSADVAAAVTEYVDASPHGTFEGLAIERAGTVDGRSATVELSAYWRPPVLTVFVPEGIRIDVTAVGRSVFG